VVQGGADVDELLRQVRTASERGGDGAPLSALLELVGGDSERLDRALADLDERGLIRVLGGHSTRDARVVAR